MAPLYILSTCGLGYEKGAELPLYLAILRNFSFHRFALEGMFEAMYGYDRPDTVCPPTKVFCLFANAGYLKNVLGFNEANYFISMVALWSNYLFFTVMAYFVIKMRLSFSDSA